MRILVTGASGFITKNFIKHALKKNKIIAISRKKNQSHKNIIWMKKK